MLEGIKNISSLCLQDFINLIHINPNKTGNNEIIKSSKELQKEGLIKIKEYISPALADELREEIEDLVIANPVSVELENGTKFNYRSEHNPNGPDSGMLDIFHIDNTVKKISSIDIEKIIQLLENVTGQEVIYLRANAYVNDSVKGTRMYHIDNTQPVIYKAFLYLTDVSDISYGPYSFIRRTHRFSFYTFLNLFKNVFSKKYRSTDMSVYPKERVVNAIGEKGDLFLSSQNGIHRGLAQEDGKKRVALVFNFLVRSKLSYINKTAKENIAMSELKKTQNKSE
ncbi:MAG: hypothetical protein MK105_00175 [Crocinitomicaceae bacterium]|nr:hypothetical protein [Crocinitomicaceae bacterium]